MAKPKQVLTKREKSLILALYAEGKTDEQIGKVLDIKRTTLLLVLEDNGITNTIKKNVKEIADKQVEKSLFKRACGYEHPSEEIFCDKNGNVTRVPITKKYAPDTIACIFWLKNRKPEEWRDRQEVMHGVDNELGELLKLARERANGKDK